MASNVFLRYEGTRRDAGLGRTVTYPWNNGHEEIGSKMARVCNRDVRAPGGIEGEFF